MNKVVLFVGLLILRTQSHEISMISSLLVTNKENIRKYYQDPQRYLQSITIVNYDKAHSFNYQLNLPSIVTECDDLPQDLFPREECIQSLLDYKRVSEISLMNYLVVKRTPGQVTEFITTVQFFRDLPVGISTPIHSFDLEALVSSLCHSLFSQLEPMDEATKSECYVEGKRVVLQELEQRVNMFGLAVGDYELPIRFSPLTISPYHAAKEFCLQHTELFSITSPEILATCIFPVKLYLERRFYTVEDLYRWSFHVEPEGY